MDEAIILRAALLWARNHLEINDPRVREKVLEVLNKVLDDYNPTLADTQYFHKLYLKGPSL